MSARKYLTDYIIEDQLDPKTGRLKSVAVYTGKWFCFVHDAETMRRLRLRCFAATASCAVFFIAGLLTAAPCCRTMYVILPYAVLEFPIFYAAAGCLRLKRAEGPIKREHRDKIANRLPTAALLILIFSAVSAVGCIVRAFVTGMTARDIIFLLCAAAMAASGGLLLSQRRLLAPEETGISGKNAG